MGHPVGDSKSLRQQTKRGLNQKSSSEKHPQPLGQRSEPAEPGSEPNGA
jgi:hypothetical protein